MRKIALELSSEKINHDNVVKQLNFTDEEKILVDIFWTPTFNNSWVIVTKEMIVKYLEFDEKIAFRKLKDILTNKHKKNGKVIFNRMKYQDYKISKSNKYNIEMSGSCWKHLLCTVDSKYTPLALNIALKFYRITMESIKLMQEDAVKRYLNTSDEYTKEIIQQEILKLTSKLKKL